MIFIVGFGTSTTYTVAILMRLAGGFFNFTFGYAALSHENLQVSSNGLQRLGPTIKHGSKVLWAV